MTGENTGSGKANETPRDRRVARIINRRRLTSAASVVILVVIFVTPFIGLVWLRRTVIRESEHSALWHTQTMLIRHLARSRGRWPASWDDLEADFEPTNNAQRTDSIDTLKVLVDVDFNIDPTTVDVSETDDPPDFVTLNSDRLPGEAMQANRRLLKYIGERQGRSNKPR